MVIDWQNVFDNAASWLFSIGAKVIIALAVLLISFRVITLVTRKIEKKLNSSKHNVDKTLSSTLMYLVKWGLKIIVIVCLIAYLGIDIGGITAIITSLGVCAGLAVNGALSNFAGGVLLLITRPFRIDDFIEAGGYSGVVEDIRMTNTRIRTGDNKVVYIPNGALSAETIINYSEKERRRVDVNFSISYDDDFAKAKSLILDFCKSHTMILKDPAPFVRISEYGASGITVSIRVWAKSSDYWAVRFDLLEGIKLEFDKNGISIPYNQLDIHIKS